MSSDPWGAWLESRARVRQRRRMSRGTTPPAPDCWMDLASNDYLGLSADPRVRAAAARAAEQGPVGAGASRVVTGTHPVHQLLEEELAGLAGAASGLVFSSGYTANLGVLQSLGGPRCTLLLDEHVHASLHDAAALSGAEVLFFDHQDLAQVGRLLAEARDRDPARRLAVVVESVYSVLGDAADLPALHRLCTEHAALLVVDEAHSLGVVEGGGACAAAGLTGAGAAPVLITATLSKAFGAQGGAVLFTGTDEQAERWRDHVVSTARSFIFDTGLSPVAATGALAAVRIAAEGTLGGELRRRRELVLELLRRRPLIHAHLDPGTAAVLSVRMPSPQAALEAARTLAERGIRVACFRPPSVPDGAARLRLSVHADHPVDRLSAAVQQIATVAERAWGAPTGCPFAHGDPRPAEHREEVFVEDPQQVRRIMADPETFSPENALVTAVALGPRARRILAGVRFQLPPVLASASGALHRRTRKVAQGFFSPRRFRAQMPRIEGIVAEELDALREAAGPGGREVVDLAETLAAAVPARSIELLTGVPNPPLPQLRRWSADSLELFWGWPDEERQVHLARSAAEFHGWLREAVEASRGSENLFGRMLAEGIAEAQVVSLGYFLVIAGQETTRMLISTALDRALREDGLWARLGDPVDGPAEAERLVSECLRAFSSVPTWRRLAAVDAEIGGRLIPAGTPVLVRLSGEEMPDHRLAFGHGPHRCLGAGLAEAETALAVHGAARRFPEARAVGEAPTWQALLSFQAPRHVLARVGQEAER